MASVNGVRRTEIVSISAAHRRLLDYLIRITREEPAEAAERWPRAARTAREYAEKEQLLLARDWTADVVLDREGDVWVVDTENGNAPRVASADERRTSLFRSLHHYPELLPLMPERPIDAETCSLCEGAGLPPVVFGNRNLRAVLCQCCGAGWMPNQK